ncbi:uncharacterized protein LOC141665222 [Apium graveolens]|uniref:uncharacterized protein LOC141665222 n=1 Tax=Apium graveolens TaxID=4045 RepID=UPI003D7A3308
MGFFTVELQGHGGGLAIMWRNTGAVEIKNSSSNFVDFEVECDQLGRWRYFNDMMYSFEKLGGRPHPRRLLEGFSNTVLECGLEELGFVGCEFTWEKFRGTPNWIQERLDRGFANQRFRNLFPNAVVHVLEVSTLDHLPMLLNLNMQVYMPKAKRFRFENIWVRESDCLNLVRDSWNVNGNESIMGGNRVRVSQVRRMGKRKSEGDE